MVTKLNKDPVKNKRAVAFIMSLLLFMVGSAVILGLWVIIEFLVAHYTKPQILGALGLLVFLVMYDLIYRLIK